MLGLSVDVTLPSQFIFLAPELASCLINISFILANNVLIRNGRKLDTGKMKQSYISACVSVTKFSLPKLKPKLTLFSERFSKYISREILFFLMCIFMENQHETLIPVKRRLSNLLSEDGCELKIT